jgi:hypothetical protein
MVDLARTCVAVDKIKRAVTGELKCVPVKDGDACIVREEIGDRARARFIHLYRHDARAFPHRVSHPRRADTGSCTHLPDQASTHLCRKHLQQWCVHYRA